jgi:hypothetical protein
MKKIISVLALALIAGSAFAADDPIIDVGRHSLGSGTPGLLGIEAISRWSNDEPIYHGPQYLAGYPTAATIWPRVVDVTCSRVSGKLSCDGYDWQPRMGRGEYLFVRPHLAVAPEPKVIIKEVVKVVEVPCCHKKIGE